MDWENQYGSRVHELQHLYGNTRMCGDFLIIFIYKFLKYVLTYILLCMHLALNSCGKKTRLLLLSWNSEQKTLKLSLKMIGCGPLKPSM